MSEDKKIEEQKKKEEIEKEFKEANERIVRDIPIYI